MRIAVLEGLRARPPTRENQRRPAVDLKAAAQRERPVGGDHRIGLRRQYAGKHNTPAGSCKIPQRRRDAFERPEQDVGENQIIRCMRADRPRADAVRLEHRHQMARAVVPHIVARGLHREGIDVGRAYARMQGAGGGDCQHAGTGADIEDARRSLRSHLRVPGDELMLAHRLAHRIERQQATARRAMVTGAEGERRFDLDADAVERNAAAVMGAVHDETAGLDRPQTGETLAHPIGRFD